MSSKRAVFLLIATVLFFALMPVGWCASDVTINHLDVDKTVYERGDFVVFTLTIRNNALNSSHMIRYQFQIRRGEIILFQSLTSNPQQLNGTSELIVTFTYGPLDYSFSDDYYIFRAFVYPDDLDGGYISEDYGASVVPEFFSSLMILSIAAMFGHIVRRRVQKLPPFPVKENKENKPTCRSHGTC
jgi:hypothetical protein